MTALNEQALEAAYNAYADACGYAIVPTGIKAAIRAYMAALDPAGPTGPVATVYGQLLWRHMDALRKGDEPRRERVFQTVEALREIWPAETKVWEDQFPSRQSGGKHG